MGQELREDCEMWKRKQELRKVKETAGHVLEAKTFVVNFRILSPNPIVKLFHCNIFVGNHCKTILAKHDTSAVFLKGMLRVPRYFPNVKIYETS